MATTLKARYFWPLLLILFTTDCTSKNIVIDRLDQPGASQSVVDPFVRLTLVHNPGMAFGFDLRPYVGAWSKPVLILMMLAVLVLLLRTYSMIPPRARLAAAGLGLACGGAIGNIVDRLRFSAGVVDFIDVGVGDHRFWTFNIADAGITVGAVLFALALLRDEEGTLPSRPAV
jgi:signal peptidase II